MSCNQTELGTIVLPTSAAAGVRALVRDAVNARHDAIYESCREFWRSQSSKPRSERALYERLDAWIAQKNPSTSRFYTTREEERAYLYEAVRRAFQIACYRNGHKPCAVRHEHVEPKKATNRDACFLLDGGEASITFKGRAVTWHVDYNNHSVDRAHGDPIARAFFAALKKVVWTRGSGDVIRHDDEYGREARLEHGGSVGIAYAFGPIGEKEREREMYPFGRPRRRRASSPRR